MNYILILLLSSFFAAFGTVIGFGGGIFMIPILVIVFKVPINIAAGSVIVALIPSSLISSFYNKKRNKIDFSAAITLEIPTVLGTIIGAYLTSILVLDTLEIIFALFVSSVGISMIKNKKDNKSFKVFKKINDLKPALIRQTEQIKYRMNYFLSGFFGLFAGVMSGLFGIGGGFLKTPIMINVFNIPPSVAAATALFMIFFTSLTGSISHLYLGHLDINYSIPIVLGFILGAFIGNKLNLKLSEKTIKILIGVGLMGAGVSVLIHTIL